MRNDAVAKAYFHQAESRLRAAEHALTERNFPFAVRLSQECVELSKAALRLYGVEYPKEHDVGGLLIEVKDRFQLGFRGWRRSFGRSRRGLQPKEVQACMEMKRRDWHLLNSLTKNRPRKRFRVL
jgi:HEPN domain-containing protein